MAVYYKLKCEKDYYALPIDAPAICVFDLKMKIATLKRYGKGKDFDLILMNAQTNQEYTEDTAMIQSNTYILIRRVPGPPRKTIVVGGPGNAEKDEVVGLVSSSTMELPDEPDYDLGNGVYFADKKHPEDQPLSRSEEDRRIKALVNTPALDWSQTTQKNPSHSGGFATRMSHGRTDCKYGHGLVGFRKPPQWYICRRCNEPGHYIQHCPTNGDPNYDVKKLIKARGIPKSMLRVHSDGLYELPNGATAVLQPNETAFEKAMEGIPSAFDTRPTIDIPPEFNCPLCTHVMKDAVICSKCCYATFCDRCIRDHLITKKMCMCGSKNVLADDLLPNRTVRGLIDNILMSKYTSISKETGTSSSVTDVGSEQYVNSRSNDICDAADSTVKNTEALANKVEAVPELTSIKKSVPEENAPVAQGNKRKMINEDKGTKKRKIQNNTACTSESNISQSGLASNEDNSGNMAFDDISSSYYYGGMPFNLPMYNPYWYSGGTPWSFDGCTASYTAGTPCMYYSTSPVLQDPNGAQSYPDEYPKALNKRISSQGSRCATRR